MKYLVSTKISAKVLTIGIIFIMISMSVGATDYYVSLTGSNSNAGTSAGTAWRTITYAATQAKAGDIVYIQGGNYGHEHVVVSNSGTSSAPIIFEGYDGTPVLDGEDWLGYGIYVIGKQYITIKSLRVKNYRYGIWVSNESHYATIDGCVADSCCNTNYTNYGYDGYGFLVQDCDYSTIKNCSATDNGGNNIFLSRSHYCTIQNCQTYSKQTVSNQFITDYYIVLAWGSHNVIRDCLCEDINGSYKGNHGFIIKDNPGSGASELHSTDNRIVNCTAKKFEECFALSHQAYNNTVDSCYADNTGKGTSFNFCFQNRDGANNNIFSNCWAVGKTGVASVYDGTEYDGTEDPNPQNQDNTLFVNCSFEGIMSNTIGVFLRNATNTTFKNCNFFNIPNMFRFSKSSTGSDDNTGTVLKNCILSGVATQYDVSSLAAPWGFSGTETGYSDMENVTATYTDFYNGFEMISGTGNISSDPLFAGTTDFHLKSQGGRWNGTAWVNDDVTSLCINAGDPADNYSNEPTPNGNRINIGVYGNTIEASKSFGTNSVRDLQYQNLIKAYPNPLSNELTIEIEGDNEKANFEILNAIGQKVFKGNFVERTTVHTCNYAPGAYFIKLEIGKKIVVKKLIKK